MFSLIAAAISAIAGLAGAAITAGNQKYLQRNAEYDAQVAAADTKEESLYSAVGTQQIMIGIIAAVGLIGLVVMVIFLNKKK